MGACVHWCMYVFVCMCTCARVWMSVCTVHLNENQKNRIQYMKLVDFIVSTNALDAL